VPPRTSTASPREARAEAPLDASKLTSVVTVSFNSGEYLAACVRSVLTSSVPVEVLVVDNRSTDDGLARLRASLDPDEARVRVLENEANLGFARANNRGLLQARGRWLLLLNPDCVVEPPTIEAMQGVLETSPDAGMAGCLILDPDGTEQGGCRRERPTPGKAFVRAFGLRRLSRRLRVEGVRDFVRQGDPLPSRPIEVDAISGAFMFVRREALEAVGLLDEGYFLHCEDLDWCERFWRAGQKVMFVPGVSVVHHKGGSSRDRPVRVLWHMHRGMIRYYRKFFRDQYPWALLWIVWAGVWLRFGALAALALVRRGAARGAGH
jgi:GT2 family glycosyltransferase